MQPIRVLSKVMAPRAFSTSAVLSVDNPQFYAMVTEFTQTSANILEHKLLEETYVELGRSESIKKAQIQANKRSVEQKRKTIKGIFEFMLPCKSILETNFRVKLDDDSHAVSRLSYL